MLVAPHFLVGTAIAVYVPEAGPAALAALTSHFVLDAIPHQDTIGENQLTYANLVMELFDATITVIIFWLVVPAWLRVYALVIGGVAILPDLLALPSLIWSQWYQLPVIKQLHRWHTKVIQGDNERMNWFWGLLPQILAVGMAVYFLTMKPL